jgi:hypothetical protein
MPLKDFWDKPQPELLNLLQTTPAGLTSDEARRRLSLYGPNSIVKESRFAVLISLLRFLINPLVIILPVASGISLALGDPNVGSVRDPNSREPAEKPSGRFAHGRRVRDRRAGRRLALYAFGHAAPVDAAADIIAVQLHVEWAAPTERCSS